ncbi:hypothetical protein IFM51744_04098 [Aspergillus udagawae]|nr:hypothetical protein IFM51744_04098 [Aspergillus udagawae]
MGGMNYRIQIQFEDGISWLARIQRFKGPSSPPDLQRYIMRTEVARWERHKSPSHSEFRLFVSHTTDSYMLEPTVPNAACASPELAIDRATYGDSRSSCDWNRKKVACRTVKKAAREPATCGVDLCPLFPSWCSGDSSDE